jgi:hypothetical protein
MCHDHLPPGPKARITKAVTLGDGYHLAHHERRMRIAEDTTERMKPIRSLDGGTGSRRLVAMRRSWWSWGSVFIAHAWTP